MKSLKLCLMTLYHPIVVTEHIKRHRGEKKNWLPVIVLLVLTLAAKRCFPKRCCFPPTRSHPTSSLRRY